MRFSKSFGPILILALALLLVPQALSARAKRGPSTPEERAKALALVRVLETAPASAEAKEARQWLTQWLTDIPDLTVKLCLSLLGPKDETAGLRGELSMQHAYSSAAYLIKHPHVGAGSTEAMLAGVQGTLRAYEAWKAADPKVYELLLESLLVKERSGTLEQHVRLQGRACR